LRQLEILGRKKARRPCGCGLNPIQEELEETVQTISRCSIRVRLQIVITVIVHCDNAMRNVKRPQSFHDAGVCLRPSLKWIFYVTGYYTAMYGISLSNW
jgi:hypothetical protein